MGRESLGGIPKSSTGILKADTVGMGKAQPNKGQEKPQERPAGIIGSSREHQNQSDHSQGQGQPSRSRPVLVALTDRPIPRYCMWGTTRIGCLPGRAGVRPGWPFAGLAWWLSDRGLLGSTEAVLSGAAATPLSRPPSEHQERWDPYCWPSPKEARLLLPPRQSQKTELPGLAKGRGRGLEPRDQPGKVRPRSDRLQIGVCRGDPGGKACLERKLEKLNRPLHRARSCAVSA